ncbi:MAG: hypothetical protein AAF721_17225 [Myxococcota bacterium]
MRVLSLAILSASALTFGCDLGYQRPDSPMSSDTDGMDDSSESSGGQGEHGHDGSHQGEDDHGDGKDDGHEDDHGDGNDDDRGDDPSDGQGDDGDDVTGDDDSDDGIDPPPSGDTSFFVSSQGRTSGDFGGLAGADEFCQGLADDAGLGDRTWRAYLSTAFIEGFGGELVNARDRIGVGPWYNFYGDLIAADVDDLHSLGIDSTVGFDENGAEVPSAEHDIVTGSDSQGFALPFFPDNPDAPAPTCFNWTVGDVNGWVWVGHVDAGEGDSWNSSHGTSCDRSGLASTAGSARVYCFAE